MRLDPKTYVASRISEGKTSRDARRCLKEPFADTRRVVEEREPEWDVRAAVEVPLVGRPASGAPILVEGRRGRIFPTAVRGAFPRVGAGAAASLSDVRTSLAQFVHPTKVLALVADATRASTLTGCFRLLPLMVLDSCLSASVVVHDGTLPVAVRCGV